MVSDFAAGSARPSQPHQIFLTIADKILDRETDTAYPSAPVPGQFNKHHNIMRSVTVRKGEPIDRALKRLKTKLDTEGILEEMRRRRNFESPMDEKKRKARSASKRNKVKWHFTNKEEIPAAAVTPAPEA